MKKILHEPRVKCFIAAKTNHRDRTIRQNGLVSFAIPDLGILFRTCRFGSHYELEYISLLSLLHFIELNQATFKNQKMDIFSTSSLLVYQVDQNAFCQKELEKYKRLAVAYKNTLKFSLSWVPESENRAEKGMLDLPPLKNSFTMNFSFDSGLVTEGQDEAFNFDFKNIRKKFK
jgi:hypothetical protein